MQSYKELTVWLKSIQLVKAIYLLTEKFPKAEMFGLTSQMRRAAVSIPSNIAEGYSRGHHAEYIQFLRIAFGSGAELETQLVLAKELAFGHGADVARAEGLLQEVLKMLSKLISSLASK
jgi:four helix bundle protein